MLKILKIFYLDLRYRKRKFDLFVEVKIVTIKKMRILLGNFFCFPDYNNNTLWF